MIKIHYNIMNKNTPLCLQFWLLHEMTFYSNLTDCLESFISLCKPFPVWKLKTQCTASCSVLTGLILTAISPQAGCTVCTYSRSNVNLKWDKNFKRFAVIILRQSCSTCYWSGPTKFAGKIPVFPLSSPVHQSGWSLERTVITLPFTKLSSSYCCAW